MFFKPFCVFAFAVMSFASQVSAATFAVTINFDDYPDDISWDLRDQDDAVVAGVTSYDSSLFGSSVTETAEISPGSYLFSIADSYGDGLCCNEGDGSYSLFIDNVEIFSSNGQFGASESFRFSVAAPVSAVPLPSAILLLGVALGGLVFAGRRSANA